MVAGDGGSVVYPDHTTAHSLTHELANYGEHSGAPTEGQTYEYAKTISAFYALFISILVIDSSSPASLSDYLG